MLQNQRTPDKNKQKNYGMSAQNFKNLPETIEKTADITKEQLAFLLATEDDAMIQDLKQRARNTGDRIYGKNVYIRGLIEFTNYCKNDCLYCGIRRSNCHADRYRLTVCSILAPLKRAKMLIHYIVEPVRELSSVAEKISGGELDIEIAYQSEDEIGELAEDFRKTATTLQRIIGDLNHILDAFAKGDYTVKSGCRDAYVGEFDTVHAKLIATTEHVSDALKSIRESSNQVAQGSDQLAVSAQDLAKNATARVITGCPVNITVLLQDSLPHANRRPFFSGTLG